MTDKKLTDNEIKKALEWCEQFTDNLVIANVDTKKRTLGLQVMQTCKSALDLINRYEAENERLQNCIDEQDIEISRLYKRIDETKADAYKEFAEKLCEDRVANDPVVIAAKCLLKELTEKLN